MSEPSFFAKLLAGAQFQLIPLGQVAEIKRGTSITKKDIEQGPVPVIAGGRGPAYYHNKNNRTGQTIVIAGSGAYAGYVSWWEKPIFVSDAFSVKPFPGLLPRYCFHWLKSLQERIHELKSGGGVPHVYPRDIAPFEVPIPCPDDPGKSLAIQAEIVRILDSFTELTAELTAELELRKKQYNHYRGQLLTFEDGEVEWKALGDVCDFTNAKPHEKFVTPDGDVALMTSKFVATQGRSARYIKRESVLTPAVEEDVALVMSDLPNGRALAKAFFVREDNRYAANQRVCLLRPKDKAQLVPRFLFYVIDRNPQLLRYDTGYDQTHLKKGWILDVNLPVPSLIEQTRIVEILDTFDTLTTSLSEGLPREIALRQKQYEYYRDLLLSFPKPVEVAEA